MPWAPGQTHQQTLDFIHATRRQLTENNGFQVALTEREYSGSEGEGEGLGGCVCGGGKGGGRGQGESWAGCASPGAGERIVGVLGFHGVDWTNRATSLGYWLAEAAQGRGTMTRAAAALVDHALTGWQLNRVEIRADVANRRSRAIPERLGFQQEGTLRQAARIGERYIDHVVYSMLAADWSRGGQTGSGPG
jgi:hypothetical protein